MDTATQAQIDAATAYEELFIPALFQEWAPRVLAAAAVAPGERVLDVACGTGVLAREAARRVGTTGFVAGLDASPGMLAVASRIAPRIAWSQGTAEALPYPDASFDAVVSQFGLMFFADRTRALREMLRVLKPGGRVAVAVWGELGRTPAYAASNARAEGARPIRCARRSRSAIAASCWRSSRARARRRLPSRPIAARRASRRCAR
jgi:SAM-dependent methyltransferase